jgi:hypothetical protein
MVTLLKYAIQKLRTWVRVTVWTSLPKVWIRVTETMWVSWKTSRVTLR